jgi:hypothetical protein
VVRTVAVAQERGTVSGRDPCSYQVPAVQGNGLGNLASASGMAVGQAEKFLGQTAVAGHTVGGRGEVGLGGAAAAVDAAAAAAVGDPVRIAGLPDIRWEVGGCIVLEGPLGVAVQGRGHCADHNVPEGADHSH